eukprot:scaffold226044_cov17-Tisochrysis_lutea.AAC.1
MGTSAAAPGFDSISGTSPTDAAAPDTAGPPSASGAAHGGNGVGGGGGVDARSAKALAADDPNLKTRGDSSCSPSKAIEGVQEDAGAVGDVGLSETLQGSAAGPPALIEQNTRVPVTRDVQGQTQAQAHVQVHVPHPQPQLQQQQQEAHQSPGKHSSTTKWPSRSEVVTSTLRAYLHQRAAL